MTELTISHSLAVPTGDLPLLVGAHRCSSQEQDARGLAVRLLCQVQERPALLLLQKQRVQQAGPGAALGRSRRELHHVLLAQRAGRRRHHHVLDHHVFVGVIIATVVHVLSDMVFAY
jgi:hypothetical protein